MFRNRCNMAIRFMGKHPNRKIVRQFPNRFIRYTVNVSKNADEINENNEVKTEEDMADKRIEKIESIMNTKAPKRRVKVEKKDKGLLERTEDSTILLTEDNKMVLND